jgi:hypothetical protein
MISQPTGAQNPAQAPQKPSSENGTATPPEPENTLPAGAPGAVGPEGENKPVDLARLAWLVTVLACTIAVAILAVQGYYGYALVTFAVAASAAINLL